MKNTTPFLAAGLLVVIALVCVRGGTLGAQSGTSKASAAASGKPFVFECPVALDASSKAAVVPKGWIPVPGKAPFPFDNITVFDGNPKDQASLVPDRDLEQSKDGKTGVSEWQFPGGAKNIWLACSYRGTPATLAVQVPDKVLRCSIISHRKSVGWEHEGKIVCE